MTGRFLALMSVGVLAASPAAAQTAPVAMEAPTPKVEESTAAADPLDQIECRKEDISGSRLRKVKVCKTKREWENQGRRAQEGWNRANRLSPGAPSKQMTGPGG
jgi:hypothetical protein